MTTPRPVFPVGTPLLIDVLLALERADLATARTLVRNHPLLDWRAAFVREQIDAAMVAALLD